ncbi:MAG: hypothetical protein LBE36_11770 [Flavobacteriaceae bacterium]|jgi:hypothetical protein|nr:hypothetical protein [Flavobacteriaceae bacterium]
MKKSLFVAAIAAISLVACTGKGGDAVQGEDTATVDTTVVETPVDTTTPAPADTTAAPAADAAAPAAEAPATEAK